jgi:hypothetical protein
VDTVQRTSRSASTRSVFYLPLTIVLGIALTLILIIPTEYFRPVAEQLNSIVVALLSIIFLMWAAPLIDTKTWKVTTKGAGWSQVIRAFVCGLAVLLILASTYAKSCLWRTLEHERDFSAVEPAPTSDRHPNYAKRKLECFTNVHRRIATCGVCQWSGSSSGL